VPLVPCSETERHSDARACLAAPQLANLQRPQRAGHSETAAKANWLAARPEWKSRLGHEERACPLKLRMCSMCSKRFTSLQGIAQGGTPDGDTVLHRGEWRSASIQGPFGLVRIGFCEETARIGRYRCVIRCREVEITVLNLVSLDYC
jgi:hypothetical protein